MRRFATDLLHLQVSGKFTMKRILLTTYPGAFLHHGGGEREIHLLADALNSVGILADIYGPTSQPIRAYQDIIHFSMMGGSDELFEEVKKAGGRRLILWPNLWFVNQPSVQHLDYLSHFLSRFDAVVFKSNAEEDHFRNYLDLSGKDIIRIWPLISPRFQRKDVSTVFKESYGLGMYALWTGIIEPQKNQLLAVKAFNGLDIDLVISGEVRDAAYAEECRRQASSNIRFVPAMPFGSELHLSAIAHCSLYTEIPLDFPGASALEAASMRRCLLLSKSAWTDEFFAERSMYASTMDPAAVRMTILQFLESGQLRGEEMLVKSTTEAISSLLAYLVAKP